MRHDRMLTRVAAAAPGGTGPGPDFSGRWRNELGSTMELAVQGGSITGTYTSAVSSGGGPVTGALAGHVNGDLIAFTVRWPAPAITAWVGQLVVAGGAEAIETLWQMTTNVADAEEPTKLWQSVLAGADRFVREPPSP
ncbi:MAG: avidin/streptavidin family protein [Acetobacteraceae bacterium]|nr:avidin/streptavidin family protein [Acetobacteraceae bacterium]